MDEPFNGVLRLRSLERARLVTALSDVDLPDDVLDSVWETSVHARAKYPLVHVTEAAWAARLSAAFDASSDEVATTLQRMHGEDLWLSCAVLEHDPEALRAFEQLLIPQIDRALRGFALGADDRDEIRQLVRLRILMPHDEAPAKLSQYHGRGRLAGWLKVVATRVALNSRRDARSHDSEDNLDALALKQTPELSCLRAEHRALFRRCLRGAFDALDARQRAIVRMHYGSNVAAVALARSYSVHESTMSRWLATARVSMAEHFERLASQAVGSQDSSAELLAVLHSQMDMSLQTLLATKASA